MLRNRIPDSSLMLWSLEAWNVDLRNPVANRVRRQLLVDMRFPIQTGCFQSAVELGEFDRGLPAIFPGSHAGGKRVAP